MSTTGYIRHYTQEEIDRLKYEEAQRYEKIQRQGTMIKTAYQYEQQPNRKERRKQQALQRSRESDNE